MKAAASVFLSVVSGAVLAHPGHGALELHWHFEDLLWLLALVCLAILIKKALKR